MKITSLTNYLEDPTSFLYLERYVNEGSRNYSPFSNQSEAEPKYQPKSEVESFEIPCLRVPKEKVTFYLNNPDPELLNHYIQNEFILFPIHPEIFEDHQILYIEELRKFPSHSMVASTTASTRTVLVRAKKDFPAHFIKLHYPRRISRFIRRLRKNSIYNCIEVSKELENLSIAKFGYLPDTIGMTFGSSDESWGFIIREVTPRIKSVVGKFLFPLFSLYSRDLKHKEDDPLLVQLIKLLKVDPVRFTLNHIMQPIIQIWCTVLKERGFLLEMHGQNVLLELDANFFPSRLIYRDLDVYVDPEIRKKKQLHTQFPKNYLISLENQESLYSLKYDAFLGHHLFDCLASLLKSYYGVNSEVLENGCKETFHHFFKDAHLYFTNKTFYYSHEIFPDNKYRILETEISPKWR